MPPWQIAAAVVVALIAAATVYGFTKLGDSDVQGAGTTPTSDFSASTAPQQRTLRVVGVGDSITYNSNSWYRQATGQVSGIVSLGDVGMPGQDSAGVLAKSLPRALEEKPDLITVEAGTNDVVEGVPVATTVTNVGKILASAKSAKIRAILVAVPPNNDRPAAVAPLNEALKALALRRDVPFFDLSHSIAAADGSYLSDMSDDGRHPNDKGAAVMTTAAVKLLTRYVATV
jgi:acyl-CoA thioesterase-1